MSSNMFYQKPHWWQFKKKRNHQSLLITSQEYTDIELVKFIFTIYAAGSMPSDRQIRMAINDFYEINKNY